MRTRTSDRWKCFAGGFDAINTYYVDFETESGFPPDIYCAPVEFDNIVNCNVRQDLIQPTSLVSTFIDDYHLERFFNRPTHYINKFNKCAAVMSPDYSLLLGMPKPMVMWQIYRNRLVGYVWAKYGCKVVPTVCWTDESSYPYFCSGIASGSAVAVSSIGMSNDNQLAHFSAGFRAMLDIVNPCQVLFMASKKYRHHFTDERIVWLNSHWERKKAAI